MMRPARGAFERGEQFLRRIEIGKTLREIDRAVLVGEPGHSADDGFGKRCKSRRWCWHKKLRSQYVWLQNLMPFLKRKFDHAL
jgi:hypothetical protein